MELREKIAKSALAGWNDAASGGCSPWHTIADYVLNLPEIAEALEYTERMTKHMAKMMADDIAKLPIKPYRPSSQ